MKRMVSILVIVMLSSTAFFATEGQVVYTGGTSKVPAGTAGRLDTSPVDELVFESAGAKLSIPYKTVESYSEETKMAHPLGVLPIIAVGLVTRLHRLHYVRISYRDEANVAQVAVFEVPKEMPQVLMPILQARMPKKPAPPRRMCVGSCASPCATSPTCNVSESK